MTTSRSRPDTVPRRNSLRRGHDGRTEPLPLDSVGEGDPRHPPCMHTLLRTCIIWSTAGRHCRQDVDDRNRKRVSQTDGSGEKRPGLTPPDAESAACLQAPSAAPQDEVVRPRVNFIRLTDFVLRFPDLLDRQVAP